MTGNFSPWARCFPDECLPRLFEVLIEEWPHFTRPVSRPLENRITHNFVDHLNRKTRYKVPFAFHYRDKQTSSDKDSEDGEIDIAVRAGIDPKVFYGFECKRLNILGSDGSIRSEAGEYIGVGGMGCFTSGQYQGGGMCAGMIGYVMNGDVATARQSVRTALLQSASELALMQPKDLVPAKDIDIRNRVFETIHSKPKDYFRILHLFLPF